MNILNKDVRVQKKVECSMCHRVFPITIVYTQGTTIYCVRCWNIRGNILWEEINEREKAWRLKNE